MAKRYDKDEKAWIIDGFQNGISSSPHAGIADMKNLNINSLPGEAAVNYARVNTLPTVFAGTMNSTGGDNSLSYTPSGSNQALIVGSVVQVSISTITNFTATTGGGPNTNQFWVVNIPSPGTYQFSNSYNGPIITDFGLTGSATFQTKAVGVPIWKGKEFVQSRNQYRYYFVDNTSQVWVNDPNVYGVYSPAGSPATTTTNCQGMGISQGVINVFVENMVYQRFTNRIGDDVLNPVPWNSYTVSSGVFLNTPPGSTASHRAITSQTSNGALFWPDSQFIGSVRGSNPQFSLINATTAGGSAMIATTGVEQGVLPIFNTPNIVVGVYTKQGGTLPAELSEDTDYYIVEVAADGETFELSASQGGSPITISAGNFYVTTFYPSLEFDSSDNSGTFIFSRQALRLPYFEQATALNEISIGSTVNLVIGGITQYSYFWDESSAGYTVTKLPEGASGVIRIVNINNTAMLFDGNKGNIYLSNGTGAAGTLSVPDYCANPNGGNQDPYFKWGDADVIRGRIFFSIQDQTSTHTGNAGGVWSFTPPQNGSLEVNLEGAGLHLENQNSYGTYNGICNLIIPSENQQAKGPQYWAMWTSDVTTPTYGIDFSSTSPYSGGQAYIDTDLISLGNFLDKGTPINFEYKLSRPLVLGESVQILARGNLTAPFALIGQGQLGGAGITMTIGMLSDVFASNIQNIQWLQCRIVLTSTATNPSFVPITQLMIRV